MKKMIGSALVGTGLAAAALTLASTAHAESAVITIGQLEAQGFNVKIDRVGAHRSTSARSPMFAIRVTARSSCVSTAEPATGTSSLSSSSGRSRCRSTARAKTAHDLGTC